MEAFFFVDFARFLAGRRICARRLRPPSSPEQPYPAGADLSRIGSGLGAVCGLQLRHGLLNISGKVLPGGINRSSVSSQRLVFFPLAQTTGGISQPAQKFIQHVQIVIQLETGQCAPPLLPLTSLTSPGMALAMFFCNESAICCNCCFCPESVFHFSILSLPMFTLAELVACCTCNIIAFRSGACGGACLCGFGETGVSRLRRRA